MFFLLSLKDDAFIDWHVGIHYVHSVDSDRNKRTLVWLDERTETHVNASVCVCVISLREFFMD